MAYDASKDKCIKLIGSVDYDGGSIEVAMWSYNNGKPKLGLNRKGQKRSGETWTSAIGRISKEELASLIPLLQKAEQEL